MYMIKRLYIATIAMHFGYSAMLATDVKLKLAHDICIRAAVIIHSYVNVA